MVNKFNRAMIFLKLVNYLKKQTLHCKKETNHFLLTHSARAFTFSRGCYYNDILKTKIPT